MLQTMNINVCVTLIYLYFIRLTIVAIFNHPKNCSLNSVSEIQNSLYFIIFPQLRELQLRQLIYKIEIDQKTSQQKIYKNRKQMGIKQNKPTHSDIQSTLDQHCYDETIQTQQCCGIVIHRTIKKKYIWEDNFMLNCKDLQIKYGWIHQLQNVVKIHGRQLPRKKFIQEFNSLKTLTQDRSSTSKSVLVTPSQIDEFKCNLRNSVLTSNGQTFKAPRPKQNNKIQSLLSPFKSKYNQLKQSFHRPESGRGLQVTIELTKQSPLKQKQKLLRQSFFKSNFRESLISFVDDTMNSLFRGQQKQISKQNVQALQIFIKFSLILQKHLNNKQNIICQVIQTFKNYILKKYIFFSNTINQHQCQNSSSQYQNYIKLQKQINKFNKQKILQLENRQNLTLQILQQLTTDIKMFLLIIRDMVQDYYKISQFIYISPQQQHNLSISSQNTSAIHHLNTNYLITNEDNLLILITTILFKNQKFYQHIFNIFKKYNQLKQKKFKNFILKNQLKQPQFYQVKKQYCLNQHTLSLFQKQANPIKQQPYSKCIQALSRLLTAKTPTSKMKIIMQCSQKITESVIQFYRINNIQLKNELLDADQILSIFCYIVSINSIPNLHSHLLMIESFATQNQMISITGYYYSVLTCALQQLQQMVQATNANQINQQCSKINERT